MAESKYGILISKLEILLKLMMEILIALILHPIQNILLLEGKIDNYKFMILMMLKMLALNLMLMILLIKLLLILNNNGLLLLLIKEFKCSIYKDKKIILFLIYLINNKSNQVQFFSFFIHFFS